MISVVLQRTLLGVDGFFCKDLKREHDKDLITYFATKMCYCLQTFKSFSTALAPRSVFNLFWRWLPVIHTIVQITVLLHLSASNTQIFSTKLSLLVIRSIWAQKFLNCLNPRFSMPSQSCAWSVARQSFRESGAVVADDVYPGTKHNGASVCSLY